VVGNPPYVNARSGYFKKEEKEYYYDNYKTAEYQLDLFILFVERAHSFMKHNASFGMIMPNTILANIYIPKIREYLVNNTSITTIGLCNKVFEEANVDTIILTTRKKVVANNTIRIYKIEEEKTEFLREVNNG